MRAITRTPIVRQIAPPCKDQILRVCAILWDYVKFLRVESVSAGQKIPFSQTLREGGESVSTATMVKPCCSISRR
jgi:hypothetical protein